MENLIKKVYEEQMTNGTFEKIVAEEFNKMVRNACNDLFSWNGSIKKELEDKLKECMCGLIDKTDFSKYVTKIKYIINDALENTAASDYKLVAESLKAILGQKHIESFSTITASEIFNKYCDYIESTQFNEYDLADHIDTEWDDDGKTAVVECKMDFDKCHRVIVFECEDVSALDENKYKFEIHLTGSNEIRFKPKININDYRYLDDFTCYLLMLTNNWVKVDFDSEYETADVNILVDN